MGAGLVGHKEHEEEHLGLAEVIVKCLSYAFKKQCFSDSVWDKMGNQNLKWWKEREKLDACF